MYVDKKLADIKAVQTLSRLNRCYSGKNETFVLDFANDPSDIQKAFERYYKTTILSGETDPNKLNDLIDTMDSMQVYTQQQINTFVELYLNNAERDKLDPIIDVCVENYKALDLEDQIAFKSSAKTFVRTYNFLSAILPYGSQEWEKLSIFLNLLVAKLPRPDSDDDDVKKIVEDVDLESYRVVAQETVAIKLADEDAEIDAIPVKTDVGIPVPEMDTLTNIIATFHVTIDGVILYCDESVSTLQLENGYSIQKVYLVEIPFRNKITDGNGNLTINYLGSQLHAKESGYGICI